MQPFFRVRKLLQSPWAHRYDVDARDLAKPSSPQRSANLIPGPYPSGWFYLCRSDEVTEREIRSFTRFGRDIVCLRTESGDVRVVDAYCPHLGAHLGNGRVVGGDLECPYHGWRFEAGSGKCVHRPGGERAVKISLEPWITIERDGFVYLWHDAEGREPHWEIPRMPEFSDSNWTRPRTRNHVVRNRVQDIAENAADVSHISHLHTLWQNLPPVDEREQEQDGPYFRHASEGPSATVVPGAEAWSRGEITFWGVGNVHARVTTWKTPEKRSEPVVRVLAMTLITPIDESSCNFASHILCERTAVAPRLLTPLMLRFLEWQMRGEIDADTMIWDQKIFIDRAPVVPEDGPIVAWRNWAAQFQPGRESERRAAHAP